MLSGKGPVRRCRRGEGESFQQLDCPFDDPMGRDGLPGFYVEVCKVWMHGMQLDVRRQQLGIDFGYGSHFVMGMYLPTSDGIIASTSVDGVKALC